MTDYEEKIRERAGINGLDLYRVGVPSIGETWPRRFRSGRSTGGLGTGVYAFRDRDPAAENESGSGTNDGVFRLENALTNPIQPRTRDATDALVKLSRAMSLVAEEVEAGRLEFEEMIDPEPRGGDIEGLTPTTPVPTFTLTGGLGGQPGVNTEKARTRFSEPGRTVLFDTPELRERYGFDTDEFIEDFFRATQDAYTSLPNGSFWNVHSVQPINKLLYPEYDGVAPADGAGGNTGVHGCVVFKEKVDRCVGRSTDAFEEVAADRLNRCFTDSG